MNKNIVGYVFVPLFLLLIVFPVVVLVGNLDLNGLVKTIGDPVFWYSVKNTVLAAFLASALDA